jgi:hypothetical protein
VPENRVYEVKPEKFTHWPEQIAKSDAARRYLQPLGIGYVLITENDLYKVEA